jgi:hypothetical protein
MAEKKAVPAIKIKIKKICGYKPLWLYACKIQVVDWFRSKVEEQGGGNYQTMLNDALRKHVEQQEQPLEEILRRVVREELKAAH